MSGMRPNRVKQKLAAGQTVLSVSGIDSPSLIDLLGPTGLDSIWLEAEHGPVDYGDIPDLTRACDLWGMTSIVRVNALALRHDLPHPRPRRPGDLRAPHRHRRRRQSVRRGREVRAARQARPVHEPPGLWRSRLPPGRQRPHRPDRADRGHQGGREPRCDPRGRPHRRVLRGALGPRRLDGPDRQDRRPQGAARPSTRRSSASSPPAATPAPC